MCWRFLSFALTFVFTVQAGKKKAKSVPDLSTLSAELGVVTARLLTEHSTISTSFGNYCTFFRGFPRALRDDEIASWTFITTGYCRLVPVMSEHAEIIGSILRDFNLLSSKSLEFAEGVSEMNGLATRAFDVAVEVQEFLLKVIEAFPTLHESFKSIKSKHSIFSSKTKEIKSVLPKQKDVFVTLTQKLFDLVQSFEKLGSSPQPSVSTTPTSTTLLPATEEPSGTVFTTVQAVEFDMSTSPSPTSPDLAAAAKEALLKAVEVRDAMSSFLISYGRLRQAIGRDTEMIRQLNSHLTFPSIRAMAWDKYVKEFAEFTRKLDQEL
jgi:hypothetical protein